MESLQWVNHDQNLQWILASVEPNPDVEPACVGAWITTWQGTEGRRNKAQSPSWDHVTSISGHYEAIFRSTLNKAGDMPIREIWIKENGISQETRIVVVPPQVPNSPNQGIGASGQFLSLLGWLE